MQTLLTLLVDTIIIIIIEGLALVIEVMETDFSLHLGDSSPDTDLNLRTQVRHQSEWTARQLF